MNPNRESGIDWGLSGSRVLITGASGGLGSRFARYLAEEGAVVVVSGRQRDRLARLASDIVSDGGNAVAVHMDVSDTQSMAQAVSEAEQAVGPIDVLLNNAGVGPFEDTLRQDVESWDSVVATNLRGPWFLSAEIAKRMRDRGHAGSILNIASIAGLRQSAFMASYSASKAALIQLTACLALEFGPYGIRVNALAPGVIDTGMTGEFPSTAAGKAMLKRIPLGRFGKAEDLKFPLLWLVSRHAGFVTGACIVVDGGSMVGSL